MILCTDLIPIAGTAIDEVTDQRPSVFKPDMLRAKAAAACKDAERLARVAAALGRLADQVEYETGRDAA